MIEILLIIIVLIVALVIIYTVDNPTIKAMVAIGSLLIIFGFVFTSDVQVTSQSVNSYSMIGVETDPLTPEQVRSVYIPTEHRGKGAGQKIGIVTCFKHTNVQRDFDTFCSKYDLPQKQLIIKSFGTRSNSTWALETSLDTQWAHVMAPAAELHLIQASTNTFAALKEALEYAASLDLNIVSMSLGANENQSVIQYMDSVFADHPNIIFMAASGDYQEVSYPSSSAHVISVGGTNLRVAQDGVQNTQSRRYAPRESDYNSRSFRKIGETAWASPRGIGTGHGISKFVESPSYQFNHTHCDYRTTPDISCAAAAYGDNGFSVCCNGKWHGVIGTSVSCPILAGIIATINSSREVKYDREQLLTRLYNEIPTTLALETSVDQAGYVGRNFIPSLINN